MTKRLGVYQARVYKNRKKGNWVSYITGPCGGWVEYNRLPSWEEAIAYALARRVFWENFFK